MLADQIVRAHRAADSLFGGPGVREFAAREFPREDPVWVATWVNGARAPARPRSSKGRFGRVVGSPEERASDSEPSSDPAPA